MEDKSERYYFFKGNQNEDDIECVDIVEKIKEDGQEWRDNWYYEVKVTDPKGIHLRNATNLADWKNNICSSY